MRVKSSELIISPKSKIQIRGEKRIKNKTLTSKVDEDSQEQVREGMVRRQWENQKVWCHRS